MCGITKPYNNPNQLCASQLQFMMGLNIIPGIKRRELCNHYHEPQSEYLYIITIKLTFTVAASCIAVLFHKSMVSALFGTKVSGLPV